MPVKPLYLCQALLLVLYGVGQPVVAQFPQQQPQRLHWQVNPKQWRGWKTPEWPATASEQLTAMEHQLYNQVYLFDTPAMRVQRLELSLGIAVLRDKPPVDRLIALKQMFDQTRQQPANQKTRVDIGLLETRLLQNRFDDWPMAKRLEQLEQMTFGQVFLQEPDQQRLHRLFEQVPLNSRSMRLIVSP